MTTFADLSLIEPLQRALAEENYDRPTPIQLQAIPPLLEGRDMLGCAQTGTGKTAAFALPVLQHLAEAPPRRGKPHIRALVLTPTRELAAQIGDSFAAYGRHLPARHQVIFGGVKENPQIAELRRGIDILVATPGRLLDLHGRGFIDFRHVDFFILDEADRMLDMGFIHDVRKVLKELPAKRQNLLFSATMPASIVKLAGSFLHEPVHVEVTPNVTTVELIQQSVMFVDRGDKRALLAQLLTQPDMERAIVFTRTKHGANRLSQQLAKSDIIAEAIHGNKSQGARLRALDGFRTGRISVLIATDIASRGIDVDDVTHVFNYELPNEPEVYVHRIGRTARAGRSGVAISFCDQTEAAYLRDIERLIGQSIPIADDHEYHCPGAMPSANPGARSKPPQRGQRAANPRESRPPQEQRRRPPPRVRTRTRVRPAASDDSPRQARAGRPGSRPNGDSPKASTDNARSDRRPSSSSSQQSQARADGDRPAPSRRRRRPKTP